MTAVAADPWASAYTIFDILNEPDSHGLTWQASGGHPGVGDLYHEVMTTGYSINPSAHWTQLTVPSRWRVGAAFMGREPASVQ